MSENGQGTLNDFAQSLIARVLFYYVGLAAVIGAVWAALTPAARGKVIGALSSLIAFRPSEVVGVRFDATGMPTPDYVAPPFQPLILVIVAITKGPDGAWVVIVLIPCLVFLFRKTKEHYDGVGGQLTLRDWTPPARRTNVVLVPISGVQRAVVHALRYAESISTDVRAIYVNDDPKAIEVLQGDWKIWGGSVRLVVLESPFRSVLEPLLEYLRKKNGIRLIVAPASLHDQERAREEGVLQVLMDAGAELFPTACGACSGYGDPMGDGITVISTTARNFKGRMGSPTAQVYLGSPYTVAAAALRGCVTDPREVLA